MDSRALGRRIGDNGVERDLEQFALARCERALVDLFLG